MNGIQVVKRNGHREPLNIEKIHQVLKWAAEGLRVSVSAVELKTHIQFFDGVSSSDIHATLIKSAADLISLETPDYQYMAARLLMFQIRKKAYGKFEPPTLLDQVSKLTHMGKYDEHILEDYSKEEFEEFDSYLDHDKDITSFSYAGVKQMVAKYLVQDRVSNEVFESPQFLYMLVSMCLFSSYPKSTRTEYVKRYYDAISTFKVSLPSPIMAGVRTKTRQFSSCVLIECGDSLDSINATNSAIVKYVSKKAGIGLGAGNIRTLGSGIGDNSVMHTGVIPFYKTFNASVNSCSQGGLRNGKATLFTPIFGLEIESILVLKNNRGVEENRVRQLDYAIQFNKLMYQRLIKGGNITLLDPNDNKKLFEYFYSDQAKFEELYLAAEADPLIRKKTIPAIELFSSFANERASTGRMYLQNVDHCNTNSPFIASVAPIKQSNLCLEIALPTKPLDDVKDPDGEIALCTLSAFNLGSLTSLDELEELTELAVRALDALLDYQEYPIPAAEKSSLNRRTLGVGVINYAYYLAKNGVKYSDGSANKLTHDTFEAIQYYLMKASMELAKEQGACPSFHETTYSQGIMPVDRYNKNVDKLTPNILNLDWNWLRTQILEHGMRNSTLSAVMPAECQSLSNKLKLKDGSTPSLGELLVSHGDIDLDFVHKEVIPGTRYSLNKPVMFANGAESYEVYWNGFHKVTEVEYEDGSSYKFTDNHQLYIGGNWVMVKELVLGDGVVRIDRDLPEEPTWDFSSNNETYSLSNGRISHNTSAQISNATNGIEPPRGLISVKASKDGVLKQVVPEYERLKDQYELLWDIPDNNGYIALVGIMQKFIDQTISANTNYDPSKFENGKVPIKTILKDMLTAYQQGVKTLYYHNSRDLATDDHSSLLEPEDDDCDTCKI